MLCATVTTPAAQGHSNTKNSLPAGSLPAVMCWHSCIPVVSYLPAAYSAYRYDIRFNDAQVGRDVLRNADAQRAWLKQAAIRHQLYFIDMTEAFVRAVKTGPLTHFPANVHFTGEGHRVAAATLENFVRDCACLGE